MRGRTIAMQIAVEKNNPNVRCDPKLCEFQKTCL